MPFEIGTSNPIILSSVLTSSFIKFIKVGIWMSSRISIFDLDVKAKIWYKILFA